MVRARYNPSPVPYSCVVKNGSKICAATFGGMPGPRSITSISGGPLSVASRGTTDGWVFYDANNDGVLDQAVLLVGVNSLGGVDSSSFV